MAHRAVRLARALGIAGALCLAAAADAPLIGTVANPDLDEISGLTRSNADSGFLWAHNDSGDGPVLYRVALDGADLGRVTVADARAIDWEDIAAFVQDGRPMLLIADTGDNDAVRNKVTLYAVDDPGSGSEARVRWQLHFRYPDGPRDCEAVAVDPLRREIILLSKRDRPPRLYRLPLPERTPAKALRAEFLGVVEGLLPATEDERRLFPLAAPYANRPTGLDISADGKRAVILTPRHAYVFDREGEQPWAEVFAGKSVRIALPYFPQIEGVALDAAGNWLFIASEQSPMGFARLRIP